MLPRSQRLTTATFAVAFGQGRILRHPLVQMRLYRRQDGQTRVRAAFVVPKKIAKAALRNRVRRRLRECYRANTGHGHQRLPVALAGCDLIFTATPAAMTAEWTQLQAAVAQLLHRAAHGMARVE